MTEARGAAAAERPLPSPLLSCFLQHEAVIPRPRFRRETGARLIWSKGFTAQGEGDQRRESEAALFHCPRGFSGTLTGGNQGAANLARKRPYSS